MLLVITIIGPNLEAYVDTRRNAEWTELRRGVPILGLVYLIYSQPCR